MSTRPVLSPEAYRRMAGIIAAVLSPGGANLSRACLTFAVVGSYLIEHLHGKEATPIAGAAFYRVSDETGFTLAYAHLNGEEVSSSKKAFHCWIECEGQVIDLLAPLFPEAVRACGRPEIVPCRMFQKPLGEMSPSPFHLEKEGDFFLKPNPSLTKELLSFWLAGPDHEAIALLCYDWYKKALVLENATGLPEVKGGGGPALMSRQFCIESSW